MIKRYDNLQLSLEYNFLILLLFCYCFLEIVTSCGAKFRHGGEKQMSDSDLVAKKHQKRSYSSIVYFKIFSITQCNSFLKFIFVSLPKNDFNYFLRLGEELIWLSCWWWSLLLFIWCWWDIWTNIFHWRYHWMWFEFC